MNKSGGLQKMRKADFEGFALINTVFVNSLFYKHSDSKTQI